MKQPEFQCGLVLLAAGGSRRMGRPKQLLPVGGQPLLRHVVESLRGAPATPFVVVLGAEAHVIQPVLADLPVQIVINPDWTEGLGSSLRVGVIALERLAPELDGLLVALADQPGLTAGHLGALLDRHRETGRSIVASNVGDRVMPPAFFSRVWFSHLRTLTGDEGARTLLQAQAAELARVPLADGADLDTPEDYVRYTRATGPAAQRRTNR